MALRWCAAAQAVIADGACDPKRLGFDSSKNTDGTDVQERTSNRGPPGAHDATSLMREAEGDDCDCITILDEPTDAA